MKGVGYFGHHGYWSAGVTGGETAIWGQQEFLEPADRWVADGERAVAKAWFDMEVQFRVIALLGYCVKYRLSNCKSYLSLTSNGP